MALRLNWNLLANLPTMPASRKLRVSMSWTHCLRLRQPRTRLNHIHLGISSFSNGPSWPWLSMAPCFCILREVCLCPVQFINNIVTSTCHWTLRPPVMPTPDNILVHARQTQSNYLTVVLAMLQVWFQPTSDIAAYAFLGGQFLVSRRRPFQEGTIRLRKLFRLLIYMPLRLKICQIREDTRLPIFSSRILWKRDYGKCGLIFDALSDTRDLL